MVAKSFKFLLVATFVAAVGHTTLRAQEEKPLDLETKKKTQELLDKAKEEYRLYFKKPESTFEYWSAVKFDMDLGKFDLAALHMKQMLAKDMPEDVDKDLVKIEAVEGMSTFLRLKQVREWSDYAPFHKEASANVDTLIDRVTKAVEKHLSDPVRIKKFMKQLVAPTEEERAFAFVQLARSRERAVPYLIEGLRTEFGKPLFVRYREMLLRMDRETVPVYLEVFKPANDKDARDLELRLTLLDIVEKRDDRRVVPYLWHLSAGKQFPEAIRKRAKEVLAGMLKISINDLAPARQELVRMAENYYQHKIPFMEGKPTKIWTWDGEAVSLTPVELTPSQTEEFFGLRYAREALDIDPSFPPAQVVLLSLMLERQYRGEVDQILMKPAQPKMRELLTTLDVDVLMRVLERAMEDKQIPVILPLMEALKDRGDARAARLSPGGAPLGVTRGLYFPDRRVQFSAMSAMLNMPTRTIPAVAADRVVELTRRFLAAGANGKALVAFTPAGQDVAVRQTVTDLGFDAVLGRGANDAVAKAKRSADFDLLVLHHGFNQADFPFIYGQMRKDADIAGLPMVLVVEKAREKAIRKFTARDANVLVLTDDRFKADDDTRERIDRHVKAVTFGRLTKEERKSFAKASLDYLWRMSRGEIKGYDATPALEAIFEQLQNPDNATLALEILGRLPGRSTDKIQYRLVGVATDPARGKLRVPAVQELNRHIQTYGLQLDQKQLAVLRDAYRDAAGEPTLRDQLSVTFSMIARPTSVQTGRDLFRFRPDAPPPPKEKEKEKEEKKDN